jgi:hypothetical protein
LAPPEPPQAVANADMMERPKSFFNTADSFAPPLEAPRVE